MIEPARNPVYENRLLEQNMTLTQLEPTRIRGALYVRIKFHIAAVSYGCIPFRAWIGVRPTA